MTLDRLLTTLKYKTIDRDRQFSFARSTLVRYWRQNDLELITTNYLSRLLVSQSTYTNP